MFHSTIPTLAAVGVFAVSVTAFAMGGRPKGDEESANHRIAPVARVQMAAPASAPAAGTRSGEQIYKASCAACHDAGVANAPKLGDKAAWASRLAIGLDGLVKSAITGKNAMPPRGASDASEGELVRAIIYMANRSGGSFKEPAAK